VRIRFRALLRQVVGMSAFAAFAVIKVPGGLAATTRAADH